MPETTITQQNCGVETFNSNNSLSFVFDTKEEFIAHLIKTKEIKKDTRKYQDDMIHLIGTLKVDSRVKKGLNWNDVVATSAVVDKGMISKYQYLPKTIKGVRTSLGIPNLELYMLHNNYHAYHSDHCYTVDLFRIPEHASHLDFSSVSANLTLFYGKRIALSRLPKSKGILGINPQRLEVDCPNAYYIAKEKGCGTDILDILRPRNRVVAYVCKIFAKK